MYDNKRDWEKSSNKSNYTTTNQKLGCDEVGSYLSNFNHLTGDVFNSKNHANKINNKLQLSSKGKFDRSVTPFNPSCNINLDHLDNGIDYIEVKLNRNIYDDSRRKNKLDSTIDRISNINKVNNISPDLKEKTVYSKDNLNDNKNNFLIHPISKKDIDQNEYQLNDSNIAVSKVIENPSISNYPNLYDGTIGSYLSVEMSKNFQVYNESGFISNANDFENFNIKIKNSKY